MGKTAFQMFTSNLKSDDEHIYIKPLCDFFKIDSEKQVVKIKNDPILSICYAKKSNKMLFGDNYLHFCLDKKGFIRWIQLLNPNIIDKKLRPSFLIYQELIFEFLYGAAEEQKMIGSLNAKLQSLKMDYSSIGHEIRITQQQLFMVLNKRYQPSLPICRSDKVTWVNRVDSKKNSILTKSSVKKPIKTGLEVKYPD